MDLVKIAAKVYLQLVVGKQAEIWRDAQSRPKMLTDPDQLNLHAHNHLVIYLDILQSTSKWHFCPIGSILCLKL